MTGPAPDCRFAVAGSKAATRERETAAALCGSTVPAAAPDLIPEGQADIVVALEPVEALRVIGQYGNPAVSAVVNSRPIFPTAVTVGDAEYPSFQKIQETIRGLARKSWFVDASEIALSLGSPLFAPSLLPIGNSRSRLLALRGTSNSG